MKRIIFLVSLMVLVIVLSCCFFRTFQIEDTNISRKYSKYKTNYNHVIEDLKDEIIKSDLPPSGDLELVNKYRKLAKNGRIQYRMNNDNLQIAFFINSGPNYREGLLYTSNGDKLFENIHNISDYSVKWSQIDNNWYIFIIKYLTSPPSPG